MREASSSPSRGEEQIILDDNWYEVELMDCPISNSVLGVSSCVILGKFPNLSGSHIPPLSNGDKDSL